MCRLDDLFLSHRSNIKLHQRADDPDVQCSGLNGVIKVNSLLFVSETSHSVIPTLPTRRAPFQSNFSVRCDGTAPLYALFVFFSGTVFLSRIP